MPPQHYDVIIIGSGQGGNPLTAAFAQNGRKTALIERKHVGGSCINFGCTPTKTMVASARVAYLARRAADYGVHTGPVQINLAEVRQRKRTIVDRFRNGQQTYLENMDNVDLLMGEAHFSGPKMVEVRMNDGGEVRQLSADAIVINTGTQAAVPPIDGLDQVPTYDSAAIMELDTVPDHLMILGGGYIGVEFGQIFHRLGSAVTIIQRSNQLMPREDPDVANELMKILCDEGIEVLLDADVKKAEALPDGQVRLTLHASDGESTVTGSHLLLAAGRTPNTDRLNLASAGIHQDDKGYIPVNDHLETNVPGIYALGDVKGGPAFTHISYDDYRILCDNVIYGGTTSVANRMVPYTVFTDPQLGRVGLSQQEAERKGLNIKVAKIPMGRIARAQEIDETRGFMKAVVDADTGQILGCAILGVEGGEIMAMIQIAMMGHLHYTALRDGTFSHPTLSEALNTLFTNLE